MKAAAVFLALLLAQAASTPARAQSVSTPVDGVVMRLGSGQPIVRARVTLTDLQSNSEATTSVMSDAGGRFLFPSVAPGSYRLTASHDGFLMADYGQRRIGKPGAPLVVDPDQPTKSVILYMTPMGAITGRVFDAYGDPVHDATVQAFKFNYRNGHRVLSPVRSAKTNDLGDFRLYWMLPGQYAVSASWAVPLTHNSANSVRVSVGESPTNAMRASPAPGNLPLYFPGVPDAASAGTIDVPPGAEVSGISFLLTDTRAASIRGQIFDPLTARPPAGASVSLQQRGAAVAAGSPPSATAGPDGQFELQNVPPGSYELIVKARGVKRSAAVPLDISGGDIEGLSLALTPAFRLSGRILEASVSTATRQPTWKSVAINLVSTTPGSPIASTNVAPDGSFTIPDVNVGEYRLQLAGMPGNLYVDEARMGAVDLLSSPVRFAGPPQDSIAIWIKSGAGTVDVTARDEKQHTLADSMIVLIPEQMARDRLQLYRSLATDGGGHAHFEGIVPGNYKVFAWDDVEDGAWLDPDFIRFYEDRGIPLRVAEGSASSIELIPLPSR